MPRLETPGKNALLNEAYNLLNRVEFQGDRAKVLTEKAFALIALANALPEDKRPAPARPFRDVAG